MKNSLILIILSLAIIISTSFAETEISREVSGEWTVEGSPYIILEGATVPQNETLTIRNGVEVIFRYRFEIQGALHAEGVENDSVYMYNDPDVGVISGGLFRYANFSGEESTFDYTSMISNASRLIEVFYGDSRLRLTFRNSRLSGTGGITTHGQTIDAITISDCLVQKNIQLGGYLLFVRGVRNITFENNVISWRNTSRYEGGLEFVLRNNLFLNYRHGFSLSSVRNVTITGNRTGPLLLDLLEHQIDTTSSYINNSQGQPRRDMGNVERVRFTDNSFTGAWTFGGGDRGIECIVENNTTGSISAYGFEETIIRDCNVKGNISCIGDGGEEFFIVENNHLFDTHSRRLEIKGENFSPIIRNNICGEATYLKVLDRATPEIYNNTFGLSCTVEDADPNIHHNVFGTAQKNQNLSTIQYREGGGGLFVNNIILAWGYGGHALEFEDESDPLISSNIFYHNWDIRALGVRCYGEPRATIRYNFFYNFETNFRDIEPEDNNLFVDPLFTRVVPFDFRLQPHSPAIDAGDPDLPDDPDGTRRDIGLIYYDQSQNNRPNITSPSKILIGYRDTLTYMTTATDESEELSFRFDDLPEWLEEQPRNEGQQHRDFVEDSSVVISGIVPENEPSFQFTVYCEDNDGAKDTLVVEVEVSTCTLLKGRISGTLTRDRSPFWVTEPAWVEAGDSLIIEPGSIIYLNDSNNLQPRPRPRLDIYGRLSCVGTEEDSIYFRGYGNYKGFLPIIGSSLDTSEYAYTQCESGINGAAMSAYQTNLIIHDCLFSRGGIRFSSGEDSSWVRIYDNVFLNNFPRVSGSNSRFEIINNLFITDSVLTEDDLRNNNTYAGRFWNSDVLSIGNIFRRSHGPYRFYDGGNLTSVGDVFIDLEYGFEFDAESISLVNSFIAPQSDEFESPLFELYNSRTIIKNSIILNSNSALLDSVGGEGNLIIQNCAFIQSDSLVEQMLDDFGILTDFNTNNDSVDTYGNLFGDLGLIDIYPLEYRLSRESRCIDAGFADDDVQDPDGTLPDIGPVAFNHDNHPIEISGSYVFPDLRMRADEVIHCGVEIVDPDSDSTAYKWDLYRLILEPDLEPSARIFLRTIGRRADITFSVDTTGNYLLRCIATDGYDLDTLYREIFALPSSVKDENTTNPIQFRLHQNYPNPFNSSTIISFELPKSTHVDLKIYDLLGRKIVELTNKSYPAGFHHLIWNANHLSSGTYICRLRSPEITGSIMINLTK